MNSKPFYLSKTFWTNVFMGVVALMLPEPYKSQFNEANLAILFSVVNIALRFISKDQITLW